MPRGIGDSLHHHRYMQMVHEAHAGTLGARHSERWAADPPLAGLLGGGGAWLMCFLGRVEPGVRWSDGEGASFLSGARGRNSW